MATIEKQMTQVLKELGIEEFSVFLVEFVEKGGTLADTQGLTGENLEALYALAYTEYNQGNYEKAEELFRLLCNLDHLEKKFWMGLGASRQMLKDWDGAIDAYTITLLFAIDDPIAPLHTAECQLAKGDRDAAISGFEYAINTAGNDPQFAAVKAQAEAKIELLKAA